MKLSVILFLFTLSAHAQLKVIESPSGTKAFIFKSGQCIMKGIELPTYENYNLTRSLIYKGYKYSGEIKVQTVDRKKIVKGLKFKSYDTSVVIMLTDLKGNYSKKMGVWVILYNK